MRSVRLRVYEHDVLVVGAPCATPKGGMAVFQPEHFAALSSYIDRTGTTALSIGHKRIRVGHHVGCLRVGPVWLEIFPKIGKERPLAAWQALLFEMLRVVAGVRLAPQEHAPLQARTGDLYDLLVTRFLALVEALMREGLARAYREVEENGLCFRGRLLVGPHLRANHVRQERVFVAYEVHDTDNLPNRALHLALERVSRTAGGLDATRRAEAALSEFPEVSGTQMRAGDWSAMRLDRRTARYREALALARMILRDERPDLRWGEFEVVSMLFDMNALFEAYLEAAARSLPGVRVRSQSVKRFWLPEMGYARVVKPDILAYVGGESQPVVLDAKWKNVPDGRPDDDDLRQVFAYLHAFEGDSGFLVYPRGSAAQRATRGAYLGKQHQAGTVFVELFDGDKPSFRCVCDALASVLGIAKSADQELGHAGPQAPSQAPQMAPSGSPA